jgi:Ca2+/Na+ antiporter
VIYFLILFVASILLIRATRKRDHTNMMMFMVLMVFGIILSFLQLIVSGFGGIIFGLLIAALNVYIFICVYSLYDLFRNEKLGINTSNGQITPGTQRTVVYMQSPSYGNQQPPPQYGAPQQPQPYPNLQPYMQQPTTYVQQPPIYAQQAHIQTVSAESQVVTTPQKTIL